MRKWYVLALAAALLALVLPACRSNGRQFEAPKKLPTDTNFHALPQAQLGIYAVFLPPGYHAPENRNKKYPLVLILHGHGSTEIRHGQHADDFGRNDVIYLAPRAPYPHEEVFMELKTPGWTAWPTVPEQLYEIGPEHKDYVDVDRLYTNWIADTVQDVRRRYRVNEQRVVIYGHSQGATYAHMFALHHPELVKAYFAFAGWYGETTEELDLHDAKILKENKVFPFLAHNRRDPALDVAQTERLAAFFSRHAVRHATFISETGDHYLTDEGKQKVASFVNEWCRGAHAVEKPTLPPFMSTQ
jgi:predicted esterase